MNVLSYLHPSIYISKVKKRGRGVFTEAALKKNIIVEVAPVIRMSSEDRKLLDRTLLHDYIFEWGRDKQSCCMALGYIPLYNHSYTANCEYEMDFSKQLITIKTVRAITEGEELFINYNGDAAKDTPVWFDVR